LKFKISERSEYKVAGLVSGVASNSDIMHRMDNMKIRIDSEITKGISEIGL